MPSSRSNDDAIGMLAELLNEVERRIERQRTLENALTRRDSQKACRDEVGQSKRLSAQDDAFQPTAVALTIGVMLVDGVR